MILIRVGRRRLNLCYLVMDEENDMTPDTAHIPPRGVRVTMEFGREFNLHGADADQYRRQVMLFLQPDPGGPTTAVAESPSPLSREISPSTGIPLRPDDPAARKRRRRK